MDIAFETELLGLEKRFCETMKSKDVSAALRLINDPCIIAGAQGVASIDKQTFAKMLQGGNWTLDDFEIRDVKIVRPSDDVAIIGYKIHEKLTVDGKPLELDAADTSTWVKKDGGWLCALHTESILGDPFGRDRLRT